MNRPCGGSQSCPPRLGPLPSNGPDLAPGTGRGALRQPRETVAAVYGRRAFCSGDL